MRNGKYWLGRITGEWQYRNLPEFKRADLVNSRAAELFEVGNLQEVPGGVLNSFRPSRTLQRIKDQGIELYSAFLFNKLSGRTAFELRHAEIDLFSLLSPYECEDIVGIYLQLVEGGILFPSSCKADTKYFEFVLKRKDKNAYIAVQVKQGGACIRLDAPEYAAFDGDVFVFQTGNLFEGQPSQNVHPLDGANMKRFCLEHLDLMPANIQRWVEVWKVLRGKGVKKASTVS